MEDIRMSKEAFKQYRLGIEVLAGNLTIVDYALQIDKSYRQAQRIINRIKEADVLGVVHGNKSRPPHNKTSLALEMKIIDLLKYKYKNFNLTHFREKLFENEKIDIKKDALHVIAKRHGLVKNPKKKRKTLA